MFKSLTAFRITDMGSFDFLFGDDPIDLLDPDSGKPIVDPDATRWSSIGFSIPQNETSGGVYVGSNNIKLLTVEIRERILPAAVIRVKVAEVVADIEDRQGRKCGRKEIAELKDDVIAALLPTSHIRRKSIRLMIHKDYLIIGTTSALVVDSILELIGKVAGARVSLAPVDRDCNVRAFLTRLLLEDTTDDCVFTQGESVTLKSERKTASFKDFDLASRSVLDTQSDGLQPVVISAMYKDRISFSVTDRLVLKRIKTLDMINLDPSIAGAEDSASQFDATVAIVGNDLVDLLNALVAECKSDEEEL